MWISLKEEREMVKWRSGFGALAAEATAINDGAIKIWNAQQARIDLLQKSQKLYSWMEKVAGMEWGSTDKESIENGNDNF